MSKSISVFGLGYVGMVTAVCLAHKGRKVVGVDLSPAKIEALRSGRSPVVEPRISELVAEGSKACRLQASSDAASAVRKTDISFLCVGTPSLRNGKLDLGHIEPVCRQIGEALREKDSFHLVVLRSTVLPGTAESIVVPTLEKSSRKRMGQDFGVCVNPEFMREGTAVADFLEPAITIIGAADPAHSVMLRQLYAWVPGRVFETSFRSAEMVKYVCNTWHAVKVAFANEVGTLAKGLGVDAEAVVEIFTADTKLNISPTYLKPGFAFGGSCLPKDVRALNYRAKELDLKLPLFQAILPSNERHLERAVEMVLETGKRNIAMRRWEGPCPDSFVQACAGGSTISRMNDRICMHASEPTVHVVSAIEPCGSVLATQIARELIGMRADAGLPSWWQQRCDYDLFHGRSINSRWHSVAE